MSKPDIPAAYEDLLTAPNTAILATILPTGAPQASPVWFLYRDGQVLVSTLAERLKHRNVIANPMVAFTVVDPERPLRYLEIRGTVAVTDDPDGAVRDAIAVEHGYADGRAFDPPGARRVTLTLTPTRIIEH